MNSNNIESKQNNNIRVLTVRWNELAIGYLMKEYGVGYFYKYDLEGMKQAKTQGCPYLIGFKNLRQTYVSQHLFPLFKCRIPGNQRRDLEEKLSELGLIHDGNKFDDFDFLVASTGRLFSDMLSFEEVINLEKNRITITKKTVKMDNKRKEFEPDEKEFA